MLFNDCIVESTTIGFRLFIPWIPGHPASNRLHVSRRPRGKESLKTHWLGYECDDCMAICLGERNKETEKYIVLTGLYWSSGPVTLIDDFR